MRNLGSIRFLIGTNLKGLRGLIGDIVDDRVGRGLINGLDNNSGSAGLGVALAVLPSLLS